QRDSTRAPSENTGVVDALNVGVEVREATAVSPGDDRAARAIEGDPGIGLLVGLRAQRTSVSGPAGIHGAAPQDALGKDIVVAAIAAVLPRDDGASLFVRYDDWVALRVPGRTNGEPLRGPRGIDDSARQDVCRIDVVATNSG